MLSEHTLNMDAYSIRGKLKKLVIPWIVYLVLFTVTRPASIQELLIGFSEHMQVGWVQSSVNFLIRGLPWLFPIFLIFSVITIWRKQPFDTIRIYEDKIGFVFEGNEREAIHSHVLFTHGSMQNSVYIEAKVLGIKNHNYLWEEFSGFDVMKTNLERYANWDATVYGRKN
ncbi:MAG: hypothetical protein ACTTJ7_08160 [Treponema sp.]